MKLKLYKYLKYEDGAKAVIEHGTMKFSRYDEFNDPFDCVVCYDLQDALDYYSSRNDLLKEVGDKLGMSPAERISYKPILLKNIESSIASGAFHEGVLSPVGICCFSLSPNNILMWSHYADNHKGIVVEFDTFQDRYANPDLVEKKLLGYPVVYSREMPKIRVRDREFEAVKDVFLTKSEHWDYEQEYRVISTHKGPGIHDFDKQMISRIVAGAKMSPDDFSDLNDRVQAANSNCDLNIKIGRAKMNQSRYEIDII